MAQGFVRDVVVCAPGFADAAPCPSGTGPAVVKAYVLEPASAGFLDVLATPVDWSGPAQLWGSAFSGLVSIWLLALMMRKLRAFFN